MKKTNLKIKKEKETTFDLKAWMEEQNAKYVEIFQIINKQLDATPTPPVWQGANSSLWETFCSVSFWLRKLHGDHPFVKRLVRSKENLEKYLDGNVVKSNYKGAMKSAMRDLEVESSQLALLTGFLIGIRALDKFGLQLVVDFDKAMSAYRPGPIPPRN